MGLTAEYIKNIFSTLKMKISNNEIVIRVKSKTPKFWKGVQKLFMGVGGVALTLWIANKELELGVGEPLISIMRHVIISSILITGTAQLTKEDSNETNS